MQRNREFQCPSLLFVEQFFWPEGWPGSRLPQAIVSELSKTHKISVVCGNKPYINPVSKTTFFDFSCFEIKYLKLPFSTHKSYKRLINHLCFSLQLLFCVCLSRPNILITQTNPPLALIFLAVLSKFLSMPLIIICMDLYPDVLISSVRSKHLAFLLNFLLNPIFRFVYNSCSAIVSLDRTMSSKISNYVVNPDKIHLIYNWSVLSEPRLTEDLIFPPAKSLENLHLLYSGNIGSSHEMNTIINGISSFNCDKCKLTVITSSASQVLLHQAASELILSHRLELLPFQDDYDFATTLSNSSLGLVSLKETSLGQVSPSKFQSYLASSLPVLYIGPPSDISTLLNQYNAGFSVRNGDQDSFCAVLDYYLNLSVSQKLSMKKNAFSLYCNLMHSSVSLPKYSRLISDILTFN